MIGNLTRAQKHIQPISFVIYILQSCFCTRRCKNRHMEKYKKVIKKSSTFLKKEMDLQKFLFRQRL